MAVHIVLETLVLPMERMYRKSAHRVARRAAAILPLICVGTMFCLSGPALPIALAQTEAKTPEPIAYKLTPGDTLEVNVLGHPELTRSLNVLPEGTVSFPYIGEVKALGMTVGEFRALITKRLSKELDDPQVTIGLTRHQEDAKMVSIIGAVKTSGKRTMGENWRVLDLIADCGGLSAQRPEWTTAMLVRGGGAETITVDMTRLMATGDVKENRLLEPGDILLIQELDVSKTQVKVYGAVVKQGMVAAPQDGSLLAVLTAVGGPTAGALLANATIVRDGQTIPVDLTSPEADGASDKGTKIKPGDTLWVPENKNTFSVIGAVGHAGTQYYPEKGQVTVLTAFLAAGGAGAGADLKKASIIRPLKDGSKDIVPIDLEAILRKSNKNKVAQKDVPLEPNDILFIPPKEGTGGSNRMTLRDALSFVPFIGMLTR